MVRSHTVTMLLAVACLAIVASTVCGCGRKEVSLRQAETIAYRWLSDMQKMLSPKAGARAEGTTTTEGDNLTQTEAPPKPVTGPATRTAPKDTASKVDQEAADKITAIDGIVLVTAPPPPKADSGSADNSATARSGSAHAVTDDSSAHRAGPSNAAKDTATAKDLAKEATADKELAEFVSGPGPQTLRDCFVDDDWDPTGFKNPTEAIAWLTERPRPLTKVKSIELVEGSAEVTFEMLDKEPVTVVARVKLVDASPKCTLLKVGA